MLLHDPFDPLVPVQGAQLLLYGVPTGLVQLGGLDALLNTDKVPLEDREGAGVEHLVLDAGLRRAPQHQEQLLLEAGGRGSLALVMIRIVVDGEPALIRTRTQQVGQEVLVARLPYPQALHPDLALVLNGEDRVPVLLQLPDLLEHVSTLAGQVYTGGHGFSGVKDYSSRSLLGQVFSKNTNWNFDCSEAAAK